MFYGIIICGLTFYPVDETIKICIDVLFKSEMTVSGLNKKDTFERLSLTLKESIIFFDNKYYNQNFSQTLFSKIKIEHISGSIA